MSKTKEISVFVDESGSFDPDRSSSRYYLVCMVFHNQDVDISRQIEDVSPERYKLFQVADLACTLELTRIKLEETGALSSSEYQFFGGTKNFRKNFLKPLLRKRKV